MSNAAGPDLHAAGHECSFRPLQQAYCLPVFEYRHRYGASQQSLSAHSGTKGTVGAQASAPLLQWCGSPPCVGEYSGLYNSIILVYSSHRASKGPKVGVSKSCSGTWS